MNHDILASTTMYIYFLGYMHWRRRHHKQAFFLTCDRKTQRIEKRQQLGADPQDFGASNRRPFVLYLSAMHSSQAYSSSLVL